MTQDKSYTIRPMQKDDIDRVYAIECAGHIEPWSREILLSCLEVHYTCLVLLDQQIVEAYAIAQIAVDECHLFNICVDKQVQHQGYGSYLLNYLIEFARDQNAKELFLEVRTSNIPALAMYKKFGFEQTALRKDYYPSANGREDAIIHRLNL